MSNFLRDHKKALQSELIALLKNRVSLVNEDRTKASDEDKRELNIFAHELDRMAEQLNDIEGSHLAVVPDSLTTRL